MLVKDQLNREINLDSTPVRLVSLVPSQTELLVDLGCRDQLVGITKFCVHPFSLRQDITVVGGTKSVHFDKIATLEPDLIICNKEENTLEMVKELEQIAPVWVSDIVTIYDSLEMVWQLGEVLEKRQQASEVIAGITAELKDFEQFVESKPFRKVAYLIWKSPFMAVGRRTFIHSLLELNHFENIIAEARYPEVSLGRLEAADLILLSTEPYPFKNDDVTELKKTLEAEIRLVDGEYFSWYGSRLTKAFAYFKTLH